MRLDMPRPYRPNGTAIYHVRVTVPQRERETVGKTALKRSLRTADPAEAKRRCPAVVDELRRLIDDAARSQDFSHNDVLALAARYRDERKHSLLDAATRDSWRPDQFDWRQEQLQEVVEEERSSEEGDPHAEAAKWGDARLDRFLASHSLTVPGAWRTAAAEAIYLAERHALADARHERLRDTPAPAPYAAAQVVSRPRSLSRLFAQYADAQHLPPKTRSHWAKIVDHFERWLNGKPPHKVEKADVFQYADHLRRQGGTGKRPLKTKSINESYLAAIRCVFGFACERGLLPDNPARGVALKPTRQETMAESVRPYTDEEVVVLLSAARKQLTPYKRWAPWLAAFTGARISEILNARKTDVGEDRGVLFLSIKPEDGGALKTADSRRRVPLHAALIAEGFPDYVASLPDGGYLFPGDWRDQYGNRTTTPKNRLGEMLRKVLPPHEGKVSPNHSFRHWLSSALRRHGVSDDLARELAGHAPSDIHARYGRGDLATLNAGIQALPSPIPPKPTSATH